LSKDHPEWIRLPGLFRWKEVCDVFASQAGHDEEWRFSVQQVVAQSESSEPLYAVQAAPRRQREARLPPRPQLTSSPAHVKERDSYA